MQRLLKEDDRAQILTIITFQEHNYYVRRWNYVK